VMELVVDSCHNVILVSMAIMMRALSFTNSLIDNFSLLHSLQGVAIPLVLAELSSGE